MMHKISELRDYLSKYLIEAIPNSAIPDGLFRRIDRKTAPTIGPSVIVRITVIIESIIVVLSFSVVVGITLNVKSSRTNVSDVILDKPYTCEVLSPKNSFIVFDATNAEAVHYSRAIQSTKDCLDELYKVTNNCNFSSPNYFLISPDLITAYGYETKYLTCYAFFNDGTAFCQDTYVDWLSGETRHGGIPYRPSSKLQLSFPNYANYPSKPSGTTYRSFINGELSPAGYDITTSISSSLLQSAGNFK